MWLFLLLLNLQPETRSLMWWEPKFRRFTVCECQQQWITKPTLTKIKRDDNRLLLPRVHRRVRPRVWAVRTVGAPGVRSCRPDRTTSKGDRAAVSGNSQWRAGSSDAKGDSKLSDVNGFALQPNIEQWIRANSSCPKCAEALQQDFQTKCFNAHLQTRQSHALCWASSL